MKELREKAGLTQAEFAKKIGKAQPTVSLWESGKAKPNISEAIIIASALGVTVEEIVNCFK